MNKTRTIGIIVFALGFLAVAYGGFTYTKETHETNIGPLSLSVDDRERVNIPLWAGIAALVVGGILFVGVGRR